MSFKSVALAVCAAIGIVCAVCAQSVKSIPADEPSYTATGAMKAPTNYREWVYLSSGLDMSYTPRVKSMSDHAMFDNVFVNPEAYAQFKATGHWPDKTILVLEVRAGQSSGSINKAGHFQGEMMGAEAHVRDDARGGWAFYSFDELGAGKLLPKTASCYSCHQDHGAVDTTFVQFYPTLLPIAKEKGTMRPEPEP